MTKLKNFIEQYRPNTKDEGDFVSKHTVDSKEDRNGNKDDVFKASNVKAYDRKKNKQGYEAGEDEKVYEELAEAELSPAEKVKREELAKMIRKANPKIDPAEAYSLAVETSRRVEESVEQLDERNEDNRLKKDIYTVNKGKEYLNKGVNFAKYTAHNIADKRGNDHGIVYPDKPSDDYDSADEKYASRKTTLRTLKTVGRKAMKEDLEEAKSLTAGLRLVSKHEGKDGYHTEVRHNKDWDEYQVHHYHNGKHLGEGPVSYHDDKADAKEAAEWCTKNNCVKNGKVITEDAEHLEEATIGDYSIKKVGMKSTIAHPDGKPTYELHLTGERIGKIEPYSAYHDRKAAGSRVVSSRKNVTRYSFGFEPGKGPQGSDPGYYTSSFYGHSSPKDAHKLAVKMHSNWKPITEDAEQLDEISRNTLGNYVKGAVRDRDFQNREAKSASQIGHDIREINPKRSKELFQKAGLHAHKSANRISGIVRAVNKLTKEDIINNAIKTYLPEAPQSVEDIFENRTQYLDDYNKGLLESLFSTLTEQNKIVMLEQMHDEDGINNLIDFAIQARNS